MRSSRTGGTAAVACRLRLKADRGDLATDPHEMAALLRRLVGDRLQTNAGA